MDARTLNKSILQWAIQGRLVPQNPADEPASILLDRAYERNQESLKGNKNKKTPNTKILFREGEWFESDGRSEEEIEVPFDIPESWQWARLKTLVVVGRDAYAKASSIPKDGYVIQLEDIEKDSGTIIKTTDPRKLTDSSNQRSFRKGCILYSKLRPYLNKVVIPEKAGYCSTELIALYFSDSLNLEYCQKFLMSPFFVDYATKMSYGAKMPRLDIKDGLNCLVPVPPIEEQNRIVARIKELEPLVMRYQEDENNLIGINSTLIPSLKKSILQWAVLGRLVPQNPADEPASILLEKIYHQRQKHRDGKSNKEIFEITIYHKDGTWFESNGHSEKIIEVPFDIPESWQWARLGSICEYIHRGKSPKYSDIEQYPVIAQKCNQWTGLDMSKCLFIDPQTLPKYDPESILKTDDILVNSTGGGTCGRVGIYKEELNQYDLAVADSHVTVIRSLISNKYLRYVLSGPFYQRAISDLSRGSTNQIELATSDLKTILIPIPPFQEQKRIVSKIETINEAIFELSIEYS